MGKTSNEDRVTVSDMTEILTETESILKEMFSKAETSHILLFGLAFLAFARNINETVKMIIERDPEFKDVIDEAKRKIGEI